MAAGDPSVIAALEAAVAADEGNVALRAHLADVLAQAGRHVEALGHAAMALRIDPGHAVAIEVVATSSAALRGPAPPAGPTGAPAGDRRADRPTDGAGPGAGQPGQGAGQPGPGPEHGQEGRQAMPAGPDIPDTADELLDRWASNDPPPGVDVGELSAPGARLADVAGMDEVKHRLELSFLAPLRNPELRARFGKSLRGGLLLWGPPGCGKTFIARALAGELGAGFYEVGLSDVLDMWVGSSERNLHAVFDTARRNRPCLLFFDELDAIGQKRTHLRGGGSTMRGVVNQFLAELDGASTDNEGVFVLGATNHPWDVDPAMLRPGRFDRMLLVLPPDPPAREAVLRLHLAGKPVEPLDLRTIVERTDGFSGADLALVCDHATERAMEASLRSGAVRPISQADLVEAVGRVRPSVGAWLETARNVATYADEGGAYDELLAYLRRRRR